MSSHEDIYLPLLLLVQPPFSLCCCCCAGLFSDLFQSDIIVASPISLATKLAEDQAAAGGKQSPESDFLSSIEVLVIDRADMLCMQVRERGMGFVGE